MLKSISEADLAARVLQQYVARKEKERAVGHPPVPLRHQRAAFGCDDGEYCNRARGRGAACMPSDPVRPSRAAGRPLCGRPFCMCCWTIPAHLTPAAACWPRSRPPRAVLLRTAAAASGSCFPAAGPAGRCPFRGPAGRWPAGPLRRRRRHHCWRRWWWWRQQCRCRCCSPEWPWRLQRRTAMRRDARQTRRQQLLDASKRNLEDLQGALFTSPRVGEVPSVTTPTAAKPVVDMRKPPPPQQQRRRQALRTTDAPTHLLAGPGGTRRKAASWTAAGGSGLPPGHGRGLRDLRGGSQPPAVARRAAAHGLCSKRAVRLR